MVVENNFVKLMYMVKIKMKIGNHQLRQSILPKNQIIFGLNGKKKNTKSFKTSESCSSCLPPPSNNFDTILERELQEKNKREKGGE